MTQRLTIVKPDDWHLHLRDNEILNCVLPFSVERFGRAIIMPNLSPPVITYQDAKRYRERINAALTKKNNFTPLMTVYLTDYTDPKNVKIGIREKILTAVKLYPANATTNSAQGVTDWRNVRGVLSVLEAEQTPLLIHGEVTNPNIDIFDRELVFIEQILTPIISEFPGLKIVLEHITTEDAAAFVSEASDKIAATITPHHLVINRNAIFDGGIRPHMYCLPIAKRERHRLALRAAATSGNSSFFLGTDSAPHTIKSKQSECGCAGIFNAPNSLEIYAQVFDEENALDKFERFASINGTNFYGLKPNEETLTLFKALWQPIGHVQIKGIGEAILPFRPKGDIGWRLE